MCVGRYVHISAGAPEVGGLDFPVALVISGCEPPDVGAETRTQVLCKKSTYLIIESSLQPQVRHCEMTTQTVFKTIFITKLNQKKNKNLVSMQF